jgi:hypothetical protein
VGVNTTAGALFARTLDGSHMICIQNDQGPIDDFDSAMEGQQLIRKLDVSDVIFLDSQQVCKVESRKILPGDLERTLKVWYQVSLQ